MSPPDKENPKKSEKITINLISQDDHLTAGSWAACGVSSDKLSFVFLSRWSNAIFSSVWKSCSFSVIEMKILGTQSVPSRPTYATHTYVLMNDVMDQGAVHKEWHWPEILGSFDKCSGLWPSREPRWLRSRFIGTWKIRISFFVLHEH